MQRSFVITGLIVTLVAVPAYKLKTRLGVDLIPDSHAPMMVEKLTGGLVKARWIKRNYIRRPHLYQSQFYE